MKQVFGPWPRIKKAIEHEDNGDTNCNGSTLQGARRVGNRRTSSDHPNYTIVRISQNTDKSTGGLR